MLRSIKQLYGDKLGALDGEIGHVQDFYFDDENWGVRYVVADTGSWLTGHLVLISPHALGGLEPSGKVLAVNLTRAQIENGPLIESHKPVSRQYEEDYYRHYGWPCYWQGDALWGSSSSPVMSLLSAPSAVTSGPPPKRTEAHLRSTLAVNGYHLQAGDGVLGHVCDFMMDDQTWGIAQLVIKTGHRFSGKEVLISASKVDRVSYEDSTVFVNLTKEAVQQSPEHVAAALATAG